MMTHQKYADPCKLFSAVSYVGSYVSLIQSEIQREIQYNQDQKANK